MTGSEAAALLKSIEKYWELSGELREIKDNTNVPSEITITNFLSCFEMVSETGKKSQPKPTTSLEKSFLRIRMNMSSEALSKLGMLTFYCFQLP